MEASGQQTDLGVQPARRPEGVGQSIRETVESMVVAIVLAFLFRGVVAEAFVIPTGSMAPTLQGRHMDVVCPECHHQYRTGASIENVESGARRGEVTRTRCPICRFALQLDKQRDVNQRSFNGDRILVSKFAYHLSEPRRWDVVVFKYPGDAKTPYIKRLAGLPGETVRIQHGNVLILDPASASEPAHRQRFRMARKPPEKVLAMLQLVDDTHHVAKRLHGGLATSRWTAAPRASAAGGWRQPEGTRFVVAAEPHVSWLHYRHKIPRAQDWRGVADGPPQPDGYDGQLITDYYAYNDASSSEATDWGGQCWVGELAVEMDVHVLSGRGELLLELVEGGVRHRCTFDLRSGRATLDIDRGRIPFSDSERRSVTHPAAATILRGPGKYHVRFANVDDQLHLWVNERLAHFDGPTTFAASRDAVPRWSPEDPGDLAPARVGAREARLEVTRLRVLRDVYYRAVEPVEPYKDSEYDHARIGYGFDVGAVMSDPRSWASTPLFASRRSVEFQLGAGQFFPLGDNSPESRDARLWSELAANGEDRCPPPYVTKELLIGKALVIYWPHSWRAGSELLPIVPNFQRMGRIR